MKALLVCCFFFLVCFTQVQSYVYLEDEYNASLQAWQALNSKAYTYVVVTTYENSVGRTTIKVRNGQVVSRTYVEKNTFDYPGNVVKSWSETTPATLGSHEGYPPVLTMDELYEYCHDNILTSDENPADQDPQYPENYARFFTDSNGLISYCAFYHDLSFSANILNVGSIRYC